MPDAERQGHDEPDPVALCQSEGQQALDLFRFERLDFFLVYAGWLGEFRGVPGDAATLERLTECGSRRAVHLVGCAGF